MPSFCQPCSVRSFAKAASHGRLAQRSTSPSVSFAAVRRSCAEIERFCSSALAFAAVALSVRSFIFSTSNSGWK
eukprot:3338698-Prymnesium_polylepis.2